MQIKKLLVMASCLTVLALLLSSCAPSPAPAPAKQGAAPTPAAPAAKPSPAAPAPAAKASPAAPAPSPTSKPGAGAPRRGGILAIANYVDPASFDLHTETSSGPIAVPYNGLLRWDPFDPDKIIGDLAEKWEASPDGLKYTFNLRQNVKWHDGKPLTSADVQISLKRVEQQPGIGQTIKGLVDRVETPDNLTAIVVLRQPSPLFLSLMALHFTGIMPKHVIEAKGNMKRDVVGTGAFKFKEYMPGASLRLVKNEDFFIKDRPYLDGVTYYIIRDGASRYAAFRVKQIHLLPPISLSINQAEMAEKQLPDAKVHQIAGVNWWYYAMPANKSPWNDVRVRKAVHLAVDRQQAIKVLELGRGAVGSVVPERFGGFSADELGKMPGYRQPKAADVVEAKRLLAEAGYGQGFSTDITARGGTAYEAAAVFMSEQLAAIGIKGTVKQASDDATFRDIQYKRLYDSMVERMLAHVLDPDIILRANFLSDAARNFRNVKDPKLDEMIEQQAGVLDPSKRKAVVRDIENYLNDVVFYVYLYWGGYWMGWWPDLMRDFVGPANLYNDQKYVDVWLAK